MHIRQTGISSFIVLIEEGKREEDGDDVMMMMEDGCYRWWCTFCLVDEIVCVCV